MLNFGMQLEDDENDVLGKAFVSHGIFPQYLPRKGKERDDFIREKLELDVEKLANLKNYIPHAELPVGVERHGWPFYGGEVNIWSLETDIGRVLIDAGICEDQFRLATGGEKIVGVFLTHGHLDHVKGLDVADADVDVFGAPGIPEVKNFLYAGQSQKIGGLSFLAKNLAGHANPALGWQVNVDGKMLFFTGDALFAGSMGKTKSLAAWKMAIKTLHEAIDHLPDETIICPGHGPATTLGDERKNNPFFL